MSECAHEWLCEFEYIITIHKPFKLNVREPIALMPRPNRMRNNEIPQNEMQKTKKRVKPTTMTTMRESE